MGQSRKATSQTVTGDPCGRECRATKMDSLSTWGFDCAMCTSRARLRPTAAAAPATKAAAKTVSALGLCGWCICRRLCTGMLMSRPLAGCLQATKCAGRECLPKRNRHISPLRTMRLSTAGATYQKSAALAFACIEKDRKASTDCRVGHRRRQETTLGLDSQVMVLSQTSGQPRVQADEWQARVDRPGRPRGRGRRHPQRLRQTRLYNPQRSWSGSGS